MLGNPKQPYTWPDTTKNRMLMVNLRGRHDLGGDRLLVGFNDELYAQFAT